MHRLAVSKIREDPTRLSHVNATLARWRASVDASAQPYLARWEELLRTDLEAALALATAESEQADAMRQASPFTCVLTAAERFAFLREWKRHAA